MVQGYPEEDNSRSGFGCSLNGIGNAGKSFATPGTKVRIGSSAFCHTELRILVDIRMSNGVHISQKNLSNEGKQSKIGS